LQVTIFIGKNFRIICGVILTHFKPSLYYQLELGTRFPLVSGHPIASSYLRYQSSIRVLDKKIDTVLEPQNARFAQPYFFMLYEVS